MVSSSSSERYESASSITASQKHEKSRRRDRRSSPPTDTEDEDPFHFDNVLSPPSPTRNKAADGTRSTLSSSLLLRRASIVPVDPTAEPAPHRFSLLRERASEETIFVQEICDAEGRRWSLRVPASGLPEDMVHMLEELEKLAVELGQALPRIVVTCSAESLSLKRIERNDTVDSSELLRPPPAVADENLGGGDAGGGRSLAKEKRRLDGLGEKGQVSEEPTKPSETSSIRRSSASEQSLTCIYLPEVSPPSQTRFSSWHSHENCNGLQPDGARILVGKFNVSSSAARKRLPQQTSTDTGDPMSTSARVLLCAQGAPTDERHCQTSGTPLSQDRNRRRDGRRRHRQLESRTVFLLRSVASETETSHAGGQAKVGITSPEDQRKVLDDSSGSGGWHRERATSSALSTALRVADSDAAGRPEGVRCDSTRS